MSDPKPQHRRDFLKLAGLAGSSVALARVAHAADVAPGAPMTAGPHLVRVTDRGIDATGRHRNTAVLNRLIAEVSAAGGGTIHFPAGRYLSGALQLRSNLTLHLDAGATLQFSEDFADFLPMVPSRWQGTPETMFSAQLRAFQVENVAITGRGTIDGAGAIWWDETFRLRAEAKRTGEAPRSRWLEAYLAANNQPADTKLPRAEGFMRPSLFQALESRNVRLEGVRFQNSPFWTTHFVTCEDVVVDGVTIYNPESPNTDGINPESSRNVRISNCHIHTDDDCITIKAGKGPWARANARPCENITITNCVLTAGAAGVGIGSEMSAGVRRVVVSNCVIDGPGSGVHLKSVRGRGGVVEDVVVAGLVIANLRSEAAIRLNTEYWEPSKPGPVNEGTPLFRHIHFRDITGRNLPRAFEISGLEELRLQNISLTNVDLESREGGVVRHADDVRLHDVCVTASVGPALRCEAADRLEIRGWQSKTVASGEPLIQMRDVQSVEISGSGRFLRGVPLLEVQGGGTRDIRVLPDNGRDAAGRLRIGAEVPENAVARG